LIPILGNDLRTILGKLGAWPCDFDQQTAVALYDAAAKHLAPNSVAVDLTPSAGKTMVILSAAAFRTGAKVVSLIEKSKVHPAEEMWFNRAFKMFKLKGTCTAAAEITNMEADMIVMRGGNMLSVMSGLKAGGILFGINTQPVAGFDPEQTGNGWAVWRKQKPVYSMEGVPNTMAPEKRDSVAMDIRGAGPVEFMGVEDAIVITEEEALALREAQEG